MDNQRSPLSWPFYYQGKSTEELRHSLLYTTLELESTKLAAQEEIRRREDQVTYLKDLLSKTSKERDQAQDKCKILLMEKLLLLQQQQQYQQTAPLSGSGISSINVDDRRRGGDSNTGLSSSDCEESIMSSPVMDSITPPQSQQLAAPKNVLPEKGKLLQAVMKAGPLLQTLLLAGPLPQWQHPPPPIDSFEIPPVQAIPSPPLHLLQQDSSIDFINGCNSNICGGVNKKKRGLVACEGSDSSTNTKYQRLFSIDY
ncbi:hypothetical protein HHK36_031742 [Tetracentron sinense]|uniref:Uncharacterized protein n=1 Tax=Tetracentron sinense TaxID=13715 RepID=A0A835CXS6_TETSI|nr:hypothetical protein HHK36_031742 [Tetracentron sinense]